MPLFDHIGELRRRLTIVVVSLLVTALVMYFATPTIIDILQDPIREFLPDGRYYVTGALGGFSIRFSVAFKCAIVICTPLIIWQILAFFLPALKPKERKWVVPTLFAAVALFYIGALFCYFVILQATFGFLIGESQAIGNVLPEATDYINFEFLLMIGFGVAFELPLIVFYLSIFRIVSYAAFRGAWRYVYVVLMVIAAVITPDPSPVTMLCMYAALLLLYEGSLAVTRIVLVRRGGKAALKEKSRLAIFADDEEE